LSLNQVIYADFPKTFKVDRI